MRTRTIGRIVYFVLFGGGVLLLRLPVFAQQVEAKGPCMCTMCPGCPNLSIGGDPANFPQTQQPVLHVMVENTAPAIARGTARIFIDVRDQTGEPVWDGLVQIWALDTGSYSERLVDRDGTQTLVLQRGNYLISSRSAGFKISSQRLEVPDSRPVYIHFALRLAPTGSPVVSPGVDYFEGLETLEIKVLVEATP